MHAPPPTFDGTGRRWTLWRWPRESWSVAEGSLRDNGCDHSPLSEADPFEVLQVLAVSEHDAEVARLRSELETATALLRRLDEWDVMRSTADGPYWRGEIASVLPDRAQAKP